MAKCNISTVDSAPSWPPNASPFFVDHSTPQCPRAFIALYFSAKMPRGNPNAHPAMYPFASLPVDPAPRDKTPARELRENGTLITHSKSWRMHAETQDQRSACLTRRLPSRARTARLAGGKTASSGRGTRIG